MRIAVIIAGTNEPSNSATLAEAFMQGIRLEHDAQIDVIRLKDLRIEHFTLEHYTAVCHSRDDFKSVQDTLSAADGIVIASPVWNFSVPSHLKNLLDRMGAFALDEKTHSKGQLNGRPFALLYTGGAPMIAWKALLYITLLHVSEAIKYYGGTVVFRHFEPRCMEGRGVFKLVVDKRADTLAHLRKKGRAFAILADHHAKTGALPLFNRIAYQFFTFAYRVGNRIMYPISTLQ